MMVASDSFSLVASGGSWSLNTSYASGVNQSNCLSKLPFGEEVGAGVGGRTTSQGYSGNDNVRQKFTGYERDNETGLDYAQARYHSPTQGRFTSPDPYNIIFEKEKGKDAKERQKFFLQYVSQPQNWNKFTYTLNNPLKYTDPDGRRPINSDDQRRLDILGDEYVAAYRANDTDRMNAIGGAINELLVAIDAAPDDPGQDSAGLKAAFWAIDQIGSTAYSYASTHNNGATVAFGSDTNKCNIFFAESYAVGAGVGFGGSGVPTNFSFRHPFTEGNVNVANTLADPAANVPNFPVTGLLPIGTGVAFANPNSNRSGHVGVHVGGTLVVHAASDRVKADSLRGLTTRLTQQYGRHPSSITYRIYKP